MSLTPIIPTHFEMETNELIELLRACLCQIFFFFLFIFSGIDVIEPSPQLTLTFGNELLSPLRIQVTVA